MGLDTKTYWLTDRQSQRDFDFDFDIDSFIQEDEFVSDSSYVIRNSFVKQKWVIRKSGPSQSQQKTRGEGSRSGPASSHWLWAVVIDCDYERLYKKALINSIIQSKTHYYWSRP
jgi:hypothetical protein